METENSNLISNCNHNNHDNHSNHNNYENHELIDIQEKFKNDKELIKNKIEELKMNLKSLEDILIMFITNTQNTNKEIYEKIFQLQEEILNNEFFIQNNLAKEFQKLFKILIFLSSQIDTQHKEFKQKIFEILNEFKNLKILSSEIDLKTLDLIEELISKLLKFTNDYNKNFIELQENQKKNNNLIESKIEALENRINKIDTKTKKTKTIKINKLPQEINNFKDLIKNMLKGNFFTYVFSLIIIIFILLILKKIDIEMYEFIKNLIQHS